jgi:hypothetical protein
MLAAYLLLLLYLVYWFSILIRNLVLDNHLVKLGTQGNTSLLFRLLEEEGWQSFTNFLRVRYKPSSHHFREKASLLHHPTLGFPRNWYPRNLGPSAVTVVLAAKHGWEVRVIFSGESIARYTTSETDIIDHHFICEHPFDKWDLVWRMNLFK